MIFTFCFYNPKEQQISIFSRVPSAHSVGFGDLDAQIMVPWIACTVGALGISSRPRHDIGKYLDPSSAGWWVRVLGFLRVQGFKVRIKVVEFIRLEGAGV